MRLRRSGPYAIRSTRRGVPADKDARDEPKRFDLYRLAAGEKVPNEVKLASGDYIAFEMY